MQDAPQQNARWIRPAADYGPLLGFFIAYKAAGLLPATAVLVGLTLLAVAAVYWLDRRIPFFPLASALVVAAFGGLTLWLDDERFIKLKPTIVSGLFGLAFLYAWLRGKLWLKAVMGHAMQIDDGGWRRLTLRWSLLFLALAVANEVVWRTQSTEFWVSFKVFGITGAVLVFSLLQLPLLHRHRIPEETEA